MTLIEVRVKPGSSRRELRREADGSWVARLHARPVEGQANAELVELIAAHFDCAKTQVRIHSGTSGRRKRVEIPVNCAHD
jgi:uncharacterized protein (TIGR00251 family)